MDIDENPYKAPLEQHGTESPKFPWRKLCVCTCYAMFCLSLIGLIWAIYMLGLLFFGTVQTKTLPRSGGRPLVFDKNVACAGSPGF